MTGREGDKRLGIKRQQIYNCYMAFEFHRKSVLHYLSNVEIQLPMPAFNLRKLAR